MAEREAGPSVVLVCPRCRGELGEDVEGATCRGCGVRYPRREGVLHLTIGREGRPAFDPQYFARLAEVEHRHFWFAARRRVILDALWRTVPDLARRALFDIGCGSGGQLEFLGASGVRLAGACDAYVESLEIVSRRLNLPLVLVDEGRLPPLGPGQTLLSLFDVLEHIDDDLATLRFLHSALEPGGVLALTVPAHPFLFDEMDELAHHRRRYRRRELRDRLEEAGFEVRFVTHFMAPLVPLLVAGRTVGRLWPGGRARAEERRAAELRVTPGFNALMAAVLAVERRWLAAGRSLPFGSSLLAVAARPGATP